MEDRQAAHEAAGGGGPGAAGAEKGGFGGIRRFSMVFPLGQRRQAQVGRLDTRTGDPLF